MRQIQFFTNHATKKCIVYFGSPFTFNQPLVTLPKLHDGKRVMLLGLSPHTVDLAISVPYERVTSAYSIVLNWGDTEKQIEELNKLSAPCLM